MVNDCIKIGLENDVSTMKKLSNLTYGQLAKYEIYSKYKLCAISHAAGILANRKKSIKRGLNPRQPYATRPVLISCYDFKIIDGMLKIPLGNRQYHDVPLNCYVRKTLSDSSIKIRSFTIALNHINICHSKEVTEIECAGIGSVDRNLRNLTVGNDEKVMQYDLGKAIDITENTRSIMKAFKGNDARIRRKVYAKYGQRRKNRINQLLHHVSKSVVQSAKEGKTAIAFEDIRHIRRLYQKGNDQGRACRGRLNSWSFAEIKRQIEYKATWEGVSVIQLSSRDTRGTSQLCPRCGKKIAQVDKKTRQLWCAYCKRWMDRDVVAAMNLSIRGRAFLSNSNGKDVFERPQGFASEAMVQESGCKEPVILKVDASKLSRIRQKSKT